MIKKKINLGFVTATFMMAAVSLSGCADSNMRPQKNTVVNQEETETQEQILEEMTDSKEVSTRDKRLHRRNNNRTNDNRRNTIRI